MTIEELKGAFAILKEMIEGLPEQAKKRRNMLEIAGYPSWENVNSNLLAFYLDANEEHGFKDLFLRSLLNVLQDNNVKLPQIDEESIYSVYREWNNIDILIEADNKEWAIIIENKIHHHLHNDLKKYWDKITSEHIIGTVLSLYGQKKEDLEKHAADGIIYHNVLHHELVAEVKKNLPAYYEESDDRHLLYLKDYIDNINRFYINKNMAPELQHTLDIYQEHKDLLDRLRGTEGELHDYVSDSLFRAMEQFGYQPPNPTTRVKGKHFYISNQDAQEGYKGFRFHVSIDELLKQNKLVLYFELHGGYTQYGNRVKKLVWEQTPSYGDIIGDSGAGYEGGQYYHIAGIHGHPLDKEAGSNLYDKLVSILQRNLFKENSIVAKAAGYLKSELNK